MAKKPGFLASLKFTGASTAVVDQGMTLSSGKTYYTTTAAQNVWDPTVLATFEDNTVPVSANDIEDVDYLMGKVTFTSGYSVTGPITMSGNWLEVLDIADARSYSISIPGELLPSHVLGDGWVDREAGRLDVGLTFEDIDGAQGLTDLDAGGGTEQLANILQNGEAKLYEACPDKANDTTCWRAWCLLNTQGINIDISDLVGSSYSGQGTLVGFATRSASFGDPEA